MASAIVYFYSCGPVQGHLSTDEAEQAFVLGRDQYGVMQFDSVFVSSTFRAVQTFAMVCRGAQWSNRAFIETLPGAEYLNTIGVRDVIEELVDAGKIQGRIDGTPGRVLVMAHTPLINSVISLCHNPRRNPNFLHGIRAEIFDERGSTGVIRWQSQGLI
ncbi:hypothetical protein HN358_00535 [Candidatus Uhrbacteria bacterium]|nr:hypothetical protein [Candidatus Uhrbacteria bacterium]MBT7717115.1 hypothetical protein [Candidatus Uhrbacteria bacterium]